MVRFQLWIKGNRTILLCILCISADMMDASQVGDYCKTCTVFQRKRQNSYSEWDVITWQKKVVRKQMRVGVWWHSESSLSCFNPGTLHYKSVSRDRDTHKPGETNKKFCGNAVTSDVIGEAGEVKLQTWHCGSILLCKISVCLGWLVDRKTDWLADWLDNWVTNQPVNQHSTTWSRLYLEKVKFAYLGAKFPTFYGSQDHALGSYFDPSETTVHHHDLFYEDPL
jgi:hypothetical protein